MTVLVALFLVSIINREVMIFKLFKVVLKHHTKWTIFRLF